MSVWEGESGTIQSQGFYYY